MFSRRSDGRRRRAPWAPLLAWAILVGALGLAGCVARDAGGGGVPASEGLEVRDGPKNSLALIDEAIRTGQIDYSTGLLYKVYAVFDEMSLPEEYRSDLPIGSGSLVVSEVQRNWHRLSPDDRAEISQYVPPVGDDRDAGDDTDLDDVPRPRNDHDRHSID